MSQDLLQLIETFCADARMGPTYFGKLAANNPHLIDRLKAGRTVTLVTDRRIRDFIAERTPTEAAE